VKWDAKRAVAALRPLLLLNQLVLTHRLSVMSIAAKIPAAVTTELRLRRTRKKTKQSSVKRMTARLAKKKLVMMHPTAAAAKRILAVTQLALTAWRCANAK